MTTPAYTPGPDGTEWCIPCEAFLPPMHEPRDQPHPRNHRGDPVTARKYPALAAQETIVPWGPGADHGIGGVDVAVTGAERDDRPDGGTVAVLTLHAWPDENDDDDDPEMEAPFIAAELTIGDLMKLGNWAYDRVIAANGTDETAGNEIQYLQVAPVMRLSVSDDRLDPTVWDGDDSDIGLMQCETSEDMRYAAMWTVYARVFDPTDAFVKAEALRDFEILYAGGDPWTEVNESKDEAVRLAHLISAGRWPIEVIDPRG